MISNNREIHPKKLKLYYTIQLEKNQHQYFGLNQKKLIKMNNLYIKDIAHRLLNILTETHGSNFLLMI